ncbi:MAG: helix-turn-helix transcriptional regulator [Bryobacteraceae bacterium]|nr:helix-turn-helix transcriptional regulator [Bryobacteraceae bacterium]
MEEAGRKLKQARERLNLRYRDVEQASQRIAERHKNDEFAIALSRLADIENKGTVPSMYRLYALCAIYRLNILEVMEWYGVDVSQLPSDAACVPLEMTHLIGFASNEHGVIQVPLSLDPGLDTSKTTFLTRMIQRWGTLPLILLNGLDLRNHRYAFIGTEDWSMYPLLQPGALVMIDETKRKIAVGGWSSELERPIYFLEQRDGYACGWCSLKDGQMVVLPHPASNCEPRVFAYPNEIEVIGQVVGMATRLYPGRRRRTRS